MKTKPLMLSVANAALYLASCALVGTGLLLELRLDDEDGARRLFGMNPDDWGEIHLVVALAFVALCLLHLLLNWAWIKAAFAKTKSAFFVLGAGAGLIAVLLLWPTDQFRLLELFD